MNTIIDCLKYNASTRQNDSAFSFIEDSGRYKNISSLDLYKNVLTISRHLKKRFAPGDFVVLLIPQGIEYIEAFLGCLYAGVVAVPLYPPASKKHSERVLAVIDDCGARIAFTTSGQKKVLDANITSIEILEYETCFFKENREVDSDYILESPNDKQLAFLQYTSGSTGTPKGVMVTHSNIIANLKSLQEVTSCSQKDVFCNWLPLFHDLGLVTTLLLPIYLGSHSIIMSPSRFMRRPLTWIEAISENKATISGAPNFAYNHCVDRTEQEQLDNIDLSSLRVVFNAAEPIDAETLESFSSHFRRSGFSMDVFYPSYGMAEATVFISGGRADRPVVTNIFNKAFLQKGTAEISQDRSVGQVLVGCGTSHVEHEIKIVSPESLEELPDGKIGEIWFSGPSVAIGYWNDLEKTKVNFGAKIKNMTSNSQSYLRTGDLGFIYNGELFISGRIKDILIINGRNYYPQDFEKAAFEAVEWLQPQGTVAFEINGKAILVQEVQRRALKNFNFEKASKIIQSLILELFEVVLEDIVFIRAGGLSKTSSGKVQRAKARQSYIRFETEMLFSFKALNQNKRFEFVAPKTDTEKTLCKIWEALLNESNIGVRDNFFTLGGQSILAFKLLAEIREKWQCNVSIAELFECQTIREQARLVEKLESKAISKIKHWKSNISSGDTNSLSYMQQSLWLVDKITKDKSQYNLPKIYHIKGKLNFEALNHSFQTIIGRHQVLRTTIHESPNLNTLRQAIKPESEFAIEVVDLTKLRIDKQKKSISTLAIEEALLPFDLASDFMLRVRLIKCSSKFNVMLVTMHHVAFDGWSESILVKELSVLYRAFCSNENNPLPPLDIQYSDYAQWQRDRLSGERLGSLLNFWKERLDGIPLVHSLPLDRQRSHNQSLDGGNFYQVFSMETTKGLNALAKENNVTLFMILSAAFSVLLHRYSNETDIVFGTPVANREHSQVNELVGLFVNSLVVRIDLSDNPAFDELIKQTKIYLLKAYQHQELPFEKIIEELEPERSPLYSPIFQVMMVLQNNDAPKFEFPGLVFKEKEAPTPAVRHDLHLGVFERENQLFLEWEYSKALFDESTIKQLAVHFEQLISGVLSKPESRVSDLPLLTHEDESKILSDWNALDEIFPQDICIHELFEKQVELTPEAVAVEFKEQRLSYSELNTLSNQLAWLLREKGIETNSVIGLVFEREPELIIAILATIKAGCAYLVIDPKAPVTRNTETLDDADVSYVLARKNYRATYHKASFNAVEFCQSNIHEIIGKYPTENVAKEAINLSSKSLAYIVYTSGSTGKPKGVMIEHSQLGNYIFSVKKRLGLHKIKTYALVSAVNTDLGNTTLFSSLCFGGHLHLIDESTAANSSALGCYLKSNQIDCMKVVPSHFSALFESSISEQVIPNKKLIFGGDRLNWDLTKKVYNAKPSVEIFNHYGPAETTIGATTYSVPKEPIESSFSCPIGKPLDNLKIYILDKNRRAVPIGVTGELFIGGQGVSRGYLNQAELTDARFVANQFVETANQRLYKTGDLARHQKNGEIEFLGRIDQQRKIRGFRVELGEIEAAILKHELIDDAVVLVKGEGERQEIVAFVTYSNDLSESIVSNLLLDYLSNTLPDYMIPTSIACRELLPLSTSGKIDRSKLLISDSVESQDYELVEASNKMEVRLTEIWQELLNKKNVGVTQSFYDLGGNSLLAIRLVSEIQATFDVEVSVGDILEHKSIRELCSAFKRLERLEERSMLVKKPANESNILSFSQQRLWIIDQIEQCKHLYNMPIAFQVTGQLDLTALQRTFQTIVERHQILRTTIEINNNEPVSVVNPIEFINFSVKQFDDTSEEQLSKLISKEIQLESTKPFDLSSDPMARLRVLRIGEYQHVLMITFHHIAFDGWSRRILTTELSIIYQKYLQGENIKLPELPIQYVDFSYWQRRYLSDDVLATHLNFWKKKLQGIPEVHSLPLDYSRPAIQDYEGLSFVQNMSGSILTKLKKIANKHDVTLFMILNAAFSVLLSRYSNEKDIVIGTPVANRTYRDLSNLVGFFVNTLVLRTKLHQEMSFRELLEQTKLDLLDSYKYQQLPFEKLVDELKPERNLSYAPLFQIMLVLNNSDEYELSLPGMDIHEIKSQCGLTRYDLVVKVSESSETLSIEWEYATTLFEESTIRQMAKSFEVLVKAINSDQKTSIKQLPILDTDEKQTLLNIQNSIQYDYPTNSCIHEMIEAQAAENPNAVAVAFGGQYISYAEINSQANQIARYLIENGVKPDSLVGLYVKPSIELLTGILAILKSGGAYVPLDPSYPAKRLEDILNESTPVCLLTQKSLNSHLDYANERTIILDQYDLFKNYDDANIDKQLIGISPRCLAYVIYTSGSSGKPKGVAIEHNSLVKSTLSRSYFYEDAPASFALFSSFAFDSSVAGIFWTLISGGKLCVLDLSTLVDFDQIISVLAKEKVSHFLALPSLYQNIIYSEVSAPQSLKVVIVAGEECQRELVHLHKNTLGWKNSRLVNEYGPTEACVWSTAYDCTRGFKNKVPIGIALPHVNLYVYDENMQLCPPGVIGELYIGGEGLARGYLHQPSLTREKFISYSSPDIKDSRLYKTGDLVRYVSNNHDTASQVLEFIGRKDQQVKIRGYRIELSEIESTIRTYSSVSDCAVVASDTNNKIAAYVVPAERASFKEDVKYADDLRDLLRRTLPEFMTPSVFVQIKRLPLTPNGKVDYKQLQQRNIDEEMNSIYIKPSTEIQRQLAEIWARVLGVSRVGVKANFFEMGGHSLSAIQMVAETRSKFQIKVNVRDLFQNQTILDFEKIVIVGESINVPVLTKAPNSQPIVLSFAQQRLWFVDQIEPGSIQYNLPIAIELTGQLNIAGLCSAFQSIVERHQVLRTTIDLDKNSDAKQTVHSDIKFNIATQDLSQLSREQQNVLIPEIIRQESTTPFDLRNDLMLRATLLKQNQDEHILLVTLHHIASDGWSQNLLIREFAIFYRENSFNQPSALPSLNFQYSDYAHWQRQCLDKGILNKDFCYWKARLENLPELHSLPLDHSRPKLQNYQGKKLTRCLDLKMLKGLNLLARQYDATLFMTLSAAFSILLSRHSNEDDIVFGTPVANREQTELNYLVGFFVNTLVLRTNLSGNPTFKELLIATKNNFLNDFEHQQLPFEKLVDELQLERSLSYSPLFQVMFALQNNEQSQIELGDLKVKPLEVSHTVAKFDLTLTATETGEGLKLQWEFASTIFEKSTIERIAKRFEILLLSILKRPERPVKELNILEVDEINQLQKSFAIPADNYIVNQCIHEIFESKASFSPDAIAVQFEHNKMTYAQLNSRANKVAHLLLDKGVEPNMLIGLCTERSIEMIIGILGILKSGGAYLPIDPDNPKDRIDYMLNDTGAEIVLTSSGKFDKIFEKSKHLFCLSHAEPFEEYSDENIHLERSGVKSTNLAYVIYTSGSTGKPKGVLVTHQNVTRLFDASKFGFDFNENDVWTLFHSFAFDFSVWEIWGALFHGGRLVVVPYWVTRSFDSFYELVCRERVTILNQTPSAFNQFSIVDKAQQQTLSLCHVVFGGEDLNLASLIPWVERHGYSTPNLINMYGITETTVHATYHKITKSDLNVSRDFSIIGRPLSDLGIAILSAEQQLVPVGVPGEMYVFGGGLARGYLNRPDLTKERFIENPYAKGKNERLYRTGDLVRWQLDSEGKLERLEYLGRLDHQVKIRGFRIELGEIETVLTEYQSVVEAVVLARDNPQRLVAYVVAEGGSSEQADFIELIRNHVKRTLPNYMVPSAFVVLDKLPLTSNGKIDRSAFPELEKYTPLEAQYIRPVNHTQQVLCEIWAEVLGLNKVGIRDNFFSIGGDSILSIKIVSKTKLEGMDVTVKDLFSSQTIESLSALIDFKKSDVTLRLEELEASILEPFSLLMERESQKIKGLVDANLIEDAYPLSVLQQGMIVHNQLNEKRGVYHDIISIHINEIWNAELFTSALKLLTDQNELLRSIILFEGERPLHLIHKNIDPPLSIIDLRVLSNERQISELKRWKDNERSRRFNWELPLWSVVIHRLTNSKFQFSLCCHHALLDGWSVATLNTELFSHYLKYLDDKSPKDFQPLPYRYYISQELSAINSDSAKRFWDDKLSNIELPWWTGKTKVNTAEVTWTLTDRHASDLIDMSMRLGVPERSILLSGYMTLLRFLSGRQNVATSVVFNGRPELTGSERTLGLFLNSLPFILSSDDNHWEDLIISINQEMLDIAEYRHYPLANIQRDKGLDFSAALFNYVNFHVYAEVQDKITVEHVEEFAETNYLFTLNCSKNSRTKVYHLTLTADSDIFGQEFLIRIKKYLSCIFDQMLTAPLSKIASVEFMEAQEKNKLLNIWNKTEARFSHDKCIHEIFEDQVSRFPNEIALIYEDQKLTYAQLNAQSNQLAHHLIELEVKPDTLVGLYLERSLNMVIAVMAVLKAGGAYLPIDPSQPTARIKYILDDSNAKLILTTDVLLPTLPVEEHLVIRLDNKEQASSLVNYSDRNIGSVCIGLYPTHMAYAIYTSGSTGMPKGVMLDHIGIGNLANWQANYFNISHKSRISQFASFTFDGSVGETFMALLNGACLVMLNRHLSPAKFVESISESAIDLIVLVPSLMKELDPSLIKTPNRLAVVAVGEACPPEMAKHWAQHCQLYNGYGPTECSVYSHIWEVTEERLDSIRSNVPIGNPIHNIKTYILDDKQQPVPTGVVGEIYLNGIGIARGYLNRPDLTAERFIPNPFLSIHSVSYEGEIKETNVQAFYNEHKGNKVINNLTKREPALMAARDIETKNRTTSLHSKTIAPQVVEASELILLIKDKLGQDLLERTKELVNEHAKTPNDYQGFQRYVLEGINNSYASSGIGRQVLSKILPFDNMAATKGVDFGFGNAEILKILTEIGAKVKGLDINPIFVEKARQQNLKVSMAKIDITPDKFEAESGLLKESQDFAISTLTLDRVNNPKNLLINMMFVLKIGGRIAIQTLLPIIGIDDGEVDNPIVYTSKENLITAGNDIEEDRSKLIAQLQELGTGDVTVHSIPYTVKSRDGIQKYQVWSISGRKINSHANLKRGYRLYRTGDLGRYLSDGSIEFIGRVDEQVKIRGLRIELSEIEINLENHPAILQAVVIAKHEPRGVVAYIVPDGGFESKEKRLVERVRADLRKAMPDYMIPAAFVVMDKLPLNTAGKVDKSSLPDADYSNVIAENYVAPGNNIEQEISDIWKRLLTLEKIGVNDNFFEVGGDSLLATRLLGNVLEKYSDCELDMTLKSIFEKPTVAGIAQTIDEANQRQKLENNKKYLHQDETNIEEGVI